MCHLLYQGLSENWMVSFSCVCITAIHFSFDAKDQRYFLSALSKKDIKRLFVCQRKINGGHLVLSCHKESDRRVLWTLLFYISPTKYELKSAHHCTFMVTENKGMKHWLGGHAKLGCVYVVKASSPSYWIAFSGSQTLHNVFNLRYTRLTF